MATEDKPLNENGNHAGAFTLGVGGHAEYTVWMTPSEDKVIHDVKVPPRKVIPIIFLPGVMGSNLRMTKKRQNELKLDHTKAWKADDIGAISTGVGNTGYGGWFRKARPEQRQMNFDPDETEVDIYKYTEDQGRFDPEGKLTQESDAQHQNVPDGLSPIPPLLTTEKGAPANATKLDKERKTESAAQKARWRGWSEIFFAGPYSNILQKIEHQMNNMFVNGQLAENWKPQPPPQASGENSPQSAPPDPLVILKKSPKDFGATVGGEAITEDDLRKISDCWYPVHAMGYNWLQSNGDSAKKIAARITGLIKGYKDRKFDCTKVIIVTHSMGGLVARALMHPNYGNLQGDPKEKRESSILGIYHNVMPTLGAGTAYKRLRFGFREKHSFSPATYMDYVASEVLAPDGEHATAILANAPAPLEMLPAKAYGADWLRVVDADGKHLQSWPDMRVDPKNPSQPPPQTPLDAIYTQPADVWWRLINPKWVNPGDPDMTHANAAQGAYDRLKDAYKFSNAIEKTFHPVTYASWCNSPSHKCYGEVVFRVTAGDTTNLPKADAWKLLTDDGKGVLTVQAGDRVLTLALQPSADAGDETVPAKRSAEHIISARGNSFVHGAERSGYEHQASFSNGEVASSTLYSLVQIAKTDTWK